jgi:hypothetical protein
MKYLRGKPIYFTRLNITTNCGPLHTSNRYSDAENLVLPFFPFATPFTRPKALHARARDFTNTLPFASLPSTESTSGFLQTDSASCLKLNREFCRPILCCPPFSNSGNFFQLNNELRLRPEIAE